MRPGQGDPWEGVIEGNNEGTVSEGLIIGVGILFELV